jgi:hypothetical protein
MNNEKYRRLTSWLIAAWFVFALSAAALHLFQTPAGAPPLAFGLAALTPILVFVAWFRISPGFRAFVLSLNPRTLTLIHSWRIVGFVFLALYTYGILPGVFALPAGWGDIAIGATAAFVANKLADRAHRTVFIVWQVLGMFDLTLAMALGTITSLISPHGVTAAPMTLLPLSLIPTFGVPLFFILHVICIAQARRWPETVQAPGGVPLESSI